jgi:DNA-binding CsgD family transcriptional regulator
MSVDQGELPHGAAVPSLVRWGLSPDADLVYRTLLTFGPRGIRDLAIDLGMSIRRARTAVEELAAVRGARPHVSASSRTPSRRLPAEPDWRAAPAAALLAELRRRKPRVVDMADYTRRHRAMLGSVALPGGTYPAGLRANELADRTTTRQRIAELVAAERHELLALHPERSFAPDAAAAALPLDRQLLARGVRMRTCGVPPDDGDASCAAAQELAGLGAEYRERADVPLKLMVFDRRVALLPVDPLDLEAGTFEIDHPAVVGALIILFDQLWSTADDPRRRGVPPIVLTPREQAVVGLLAEGHTDSSAAQHLGISQRTIAYTLRALMDRIGVENRFQLGLALGATRAVMMPAIHQEEN